jgi:uncharacterized protein (DUF2336 family)
MQIVQNFGGMKSLNDIVSMVTQESRDFEHLLDLARDKSVASRTRLVETVSDLFFGTKKTLSDRERALMIEILRRLIHDVEMAVRKALAERLSVEPDAPSDLIVALANDEIDVAHPILVKSNVLQDPELIEIIHQRTMEHQLAVAVRQRLSPVVSDALVATGNADVIRTLLENHGAEINQATLGYLVEQSKRVDSYQNPLVMRPDLSAELAKRMYWWVSAALRKHIVAHFAIDPLELDQRVEEIVTDLIGQNAGGQPALARRSEELAKKVAERGTISPQLLVQTLRQGEVALFEALLAEMSKLRRALVRRIVFEPGGQGLAVIARAIGIAKPDFASIFLLSRSARPGDKVVDPGELSRVMSFFDRVQPTAAQRLLVRMRLDPEYLKSMIEVDERAGGLDPADVAQLKAANSA